MDSCSLPCDEPLNEDVSEAPPQEAPTIPDAEDAPPFRRSVVKCVTSNPLIDLVLRPGGGRG